VSVAVAVAKTRSGLGTYNLHLTYEV